MRGLILAKHIQIKDMVFHIHPHGDQIIDQQAVTHTDPQGEMLFAGEIGNPGSTKQIKGVIERSSARQKGLAG